MRFKSRTRRDAAREKEKNLGLMVALKRIERAQAQGREFNTASPRPERRVDHGKY